MTITVDLTKQFVHAHDIRDMRATTGPVSYVTFTTRDGERVVLYVSSAHAHFLERGWEDAENYEPEPVNYDEALARQCAAKAREDEARKLK